MNEKRQYKPFVEISVRCFTVCWSRATYSYHSAQSASGLASAVLDLTRFIYGQNNVAFIIDRVRRFNYKRRQREVKLICCCSSISPTSDERRLGLERSSIFFAGAAGHDRSDSATDGLLFRWR